MNEKTSYYFSVEGETELRYLAWLERAINADPSTMQKVRFYVRVAKDPFGRAKGLPHFGDLRITHFCDLESADEAHVRHFQRILARMHAAEATFDHVTYELGYCNYTFELWILLHRLDLFEPVRSREDYLALINRAFNEKFQGFGQYKREKGFTRVLRQLTLGDVHDAVRRAEHIELENELYQDPVLCCGYSYYPNNPALSVGSVIGEILEECGLFS